MICNARSNYGHIGGTTHKGIVEILWERVELHHLKYVYLYRLARIRNVICHVLHLLIIQNHFELSDHILLHLSYSLIDSPC